MKGELSERIYHRAVLGSKFTLAQVQIPGAVCRTAVSKGRAMGAWDCLHFLVGRVWENIRYSNVKTKHHPAFLIPCSLIHSFIH